MELAVNQIGIYFMWLSLLFVIIATRMYGKQDYVSEFYYVLEEKKRQVFFFLFLADISLAIQLVVEPSIWYTLCSVGLLGIAGMPRYEDKFLRIAHPIAAYIGIFCGFIGIGLDPNVQELDYYFKYMEWIPLALFLINCLIILIVKNIKFKVYWYEISAIIWSFLPITSTYY